MSRDKPLTHVPGHDSRRGNHGYPRSGATSPEIIMPAGIARVAVTHLNGASEGTARLRAAAVGLGRGEREHRCRQ
jgi:hypothetical protein